MNTSDRIALVLSLIAVVLAAWVAGQVFENLPHLEDEMAYTWQADALARGSLTVPSPVCTRCFLVPFVVDHNGLRFGKYPPGFPAVLALGVLVGQRGLVNPILSGLTIWLIYRLTKKVLDEKTALLACLLTVTSPFFVMNSGTLLSHPWSLLLTVAFSLAWLNTFDRRLPERRRWRMAAAAGICLAALALTRPLTGVAVALPFAVHGLILLIRGDAADRKLALAIAALAAGGGFLYFLWQYAVTGDPLTNPYTLWWPYDTVGFGTGVGRQAGGYHLADALPNLHVSLYFGSFDLFGWPGFSWLFMPFGLIAIRRNPRALLVSSVLLAVIAAYTLYWIGSWLFGPRYYYEALGSMVLLTSAGIAWLAGKLAPASSPAGERAWRRLRFALVSGVVMLLVACNLLYYLPARVTGLRGLYGVSREHLAPFQTASARALTPALILVHPQEDWIEYGTLLDLNSPFLDTPFVVAISRGEELDQKVIAMFPERTVRHYYPDEPDLFYLEQRPTPVE